MKLLIQLFVLSGILIMAQFSYAQTVIPLWEKDIPNSQPSDEKEDHFLERGFEYYNFVQKPAVTVYPAPAENNTGMAAVICPGGGYWREAWTKEGIHTAEWLNSIGISGVVLKYRLPHSKSIEVRYEAPLQDAQRAIRLVRNRAAEWGIDPGKIGIIGFSAGGHLASTVATHYDPGNCRAKDPIERVSSRPDFAVLVYPVVTMKEDCTHKGSRDNLLGSNPSKSLVDYFSNELQVTPNTPPTFLLHGDDDDVVPVQNSLQFYDALQKNGVPAEMHIFKHGPHGFGIKYAPEPISGWTGLAGAWLAGLNEIRLAKIFGDKMVLQRDIEVPVWGFGEPGDSVKVSFKDENYETTVNENGRWEIRLKPMAAGGPYTMIVTGQGKRLRVKDILVGDVWVCGGQSNMEWPIERSNNPHQEINAANWPEIRILTVPRRMANTPKKDLASVVWKDAVGANISDFSAVGYFFGRELHKELDVPIGLISDNWGGTVAETWMSAGAIKKFGDFDESVKKAQNDPRTIEQILYEISKANGSAGLESDPGMKDGAPVWAMSGIDDSGWTPIQVPGLWERADIGMRGYDGVAWLRKTIEVPANVAGQSLNLKVGRVDDSDETWFNGFKVGSIENQYSRPRSYFVPGMLVNPGQNVITVRVVDTGGGGGIWGEPELLSLETPDGSFYLSLAGDWKIKAAAPIQTNGRTVDGIHPNARTSLLYNGMLKPIIPFGIKGAIWYQGESNAGRAYQYRTLFPAMITDWRAQWGQGDFPFFFVQLANFRAAQDMPGESDWAELREAQTMTLSLPNTGMATIIDIGEADDIHPRNKQDVGKRLAASAKKVAYDMDVVHSGPIYDNMKIEEDKIRIRFTSVGSGLVAEDKYGWVKEFAIAGKDKKFVWANAKIEGDEVVVWSSEVANPVAVRYAWADNPDEANLYNKEGLPASPFRTDNWPGVTYTAK